MVENRVARAVVMGDDGSRRHAEKPRSPEQDIKDHTRRRHCSQEGHLGEVADQGGIDDADQGNGDGGQEVGNGEPQNPLVQLTHPQTALDGGDSFSWAPRLPARVRFPEKPGEIQPAGHEDDALLLQQLPLQLV